MKTVLYDIRDDVETLSAMENASRSQTGMIPRHDLAPSGDFWADVRAGSIRSEIIDGTIESLFMSGHNDFPEFSMLTSSGETFEFARYGAWQDYQVGTHVFVEFVEHKWYPSEILDAGILGDTFPLVLRVWVEADKSSADT